MSCTNLTKDIFVDKNKGPTLKIKKMTEILGISQLSQRKPRGVSKGTNRRGVVEGVTPPTGQF